MSNTLRSKYSLQTIQQKIIPYLKARNVHKAIIFGSRARGTDTKMSDIDLLIVVETDQRWFKRFLEFEGLYDMFPKCHLELFIYTPNELQKIAHRPFMKSIMNEGVSIYE